eukprot:GFYU01001334.1.p1 GENE.GFYU01001334.1~~GFYU01001334.1.p1  ORF type:complete len:513 (-),score=174.92 GFYU01001334.1:404-1942(-)
MVLGELGASIKNALSKLQTSPVIDEEVLDMVLKEISAGLLRADVNIKIVKSIKDNIKKIVDFEELAAGTNKRKLIHQAVFKELCAMLGSGLNSYQPQRGRPNVIMFVGLQGSGKTTTCTKYAWHYARKGWRTCLICADTFRAGAFDQLKQNATKAKIPFYGSYTDTDPAKIAADGVNQFKAENYEIIIVDTSGRHMQQEALFEEMQQVNAAVDPDEVIFVMDSSIGQAVQSQAEAFKKAVDVGSVIVTKLDGHASGGGALSAVSSTRSPVIFIGTGEHMDDFEPFDVNRFVQRLLGMGDMTGLIDTLKEAGLEEQGPALMERISQGVFTMRDMYEQFQNIMKMGPLSKVMSMIPGLGADLIPKGQEKEGQARLKRFCCIMDSMNDDELDGVCKLEASRMARIARGSGTSIREVSQLVEEHKRFSKMVSKMGKIGKGKGADLTQMSRNPQAMMRQLQGAMDPRMLQQMGGQQNMMNMMKQLGNMDLGSLMGSMGMGGMPGMPGMPGMGGGKRR